LTHSGWDDLEAIWTTLTEKAGNFDDALTPLSIDAEEFSAKDKTISIEDFIEFWLLYLSIS
jgi:hypothetical protein